jgi:hypothetical protein
VDKPLFSVTTEPGSGNLSAKPYFASLVGPRRVAAGARKSFTLNNEGSVQLVSNTGTGKGVCFVSVTLVPGIAPTLVLFGSNETPSDSDGIPEVLSTASTGVLRFQAVLNPGEMLFASLPSTAAAGTSVSLVVSTEWY